jgi:hypothetical protein
MSSFEGVQTFLFSSFFVDLVAMISVLCFELKNGLANQFLDQEKVNRAI